jgi:hypothetical protein
VAVEPIRPVDGRRDVAPVERIQLTPIEREERRREREERRRRRRGPAPGTPAGDGRDGLDIRA